MIWTSNVDDKNSISALSIEAFPSDVFMQNFSYFDSKYN